MKERDRVRPELASVSPHRPILSAAVLIYRSVHRFRFDMSIAFICGVCRSTSVLRLRIFHLVRKEQRHHQNVKGKREGTKNDGGSCLPLSASLSSHPISLRCFVQSLIFVGDGLARNVMEGMIFGERAHEEVD